MFSVCLCPHFQFDPRDSYFKVVKNIFKYFIATTNMSLFYEKNKYFWLVGFYDTNNAGDKIERKNTSGRCHFLGPCFISWSSKK
uniref:Retrovirus-related Pol polyprotein from transposon TNT 1-94 n=1 Tax=Cajanus cajan TaxID=3821 RepID=A0A151S3T2_CAJCA|nr:hypothetical protein KK1_028829 [Cajanus cajan]